jgi:hypothetical protein
VHAEDRVIGARAHEKACGKKNAIILGRRIDVLDAVDRLHDHFERLGDKTHRVLCLEAIRPQRNVDHRHRDLRLLLARECDQGQQSQCERGKKNERRQR